MAAKTYNASLGGIFLDLLKDVFFFPFWWYSFGLIMVVKSLANFIADQERSLAFFVWVKNLFVPMYGQRDWQGFLISFFVRLVQIIFRGAFLLILVVAALIAFWLWLIFPALVVYMIIWQLTAK